MFRRKQDVDRHVSSILGRIKDEREKNAKGYQIARLYFEVGEFEIARRYLASYLSVRETVPQAFRLLGQIEEAVGNKENAVEAYRRFLDMGGTGKEVVLKICELYSDIGVDPGKGKYWLEKAEQLYPQSEVIFRLKEKLITASPGQSNDGDLEHLIASELLKKPHDLDLRIKLLRVYLDSDRLEEAYSHAKDTERTTAFSSCLKWYECLLEVLRAYQSQNDVRQDVEFVFHYLVVLCNLTYLRLADKDIVESAEALHSFDQAVQRATHLNNPSEQWEAFVTEMQGQLFFLAGTLLLKRAQNGSVSWSDMRPVAGVMYLLCQTVPTVDAQAAWFVCPAQDRQKLYAWLYSNSFFRMSQSGHTLYHLCQGDRATWAQRLQQQCCSPAGQERLYEALFPIRDMRSATAQSYLVNTHKFCNTPLAMPPRRQLYDVDRVAHTFHPDRLSEMVWLCLQQYSFGDPHQPDYNFKTFETLQYSVKNLENGAAETLCLLDTEAFLDATVRCAALQLKEQQLSVDGDVSRPPMLPLCLCKKLCSPEQEQWWRTAHNFYSNTIKENFSKMRHILQRGIEVVRLVGNHGLSSAMVVHLAKTFEAKVKSLAEGDHGTRGSVNQVACLEARAAFYWRHALAMLTRLEKNQRGPQVKVCLFDDGDDGDLTPATTQELLQDAKFASATIAMREGRYEDAIRGFERLTTPYASFYRAQIYKSMAQRELEGPGLEESRRQKYTALVSQARDALYLTMDHLGGNKNHELNILLTRELDDVESKLNCFEWETESSQRDELDEPSGLRTPVKHQNGHSMVTHPHSTPKSPSHHSQTVRQRLLLSEVTTDSPIQPQPVPVSSPAAHTRPSPERLDAQIKSINYSQTQLFKMVLDRNEELVVMYRGLLDQLNESNAQLKTALGDNHALMDELKGVLSTNKDTMTTMKSELAEAKDAIRQLKDDCQANVSAAAAAAAASSANMLSAQGLAASQMSAAGYFMGSPYHPSQYPLYPQAPQLTPGAGYRYPLLPGYPPRPNTPVAPPTAAAARISERTGGTAPSSFGKFRGGDHHAEVMTTTEDEEEDEENGLSVCGSEYGEGLLQTPGAQYYVPAPDPSTGPADWMAGALHSGTGGLTYPAAVNPPPPQVPHPQVPQPGYFASALKGQSLQYSSSPAMPGPGFFSTPPPPTAAVLGGASQSAIMAALAAKQGLGHLAGQQQLPPQPQPIPVIGAGASKSPQPAFPSAKGPETQGLVILFQDFAKLTTTGEDMPTVDVRVIQDTATKQGSILVRKKDSVEILASHNIAVMRVVQSFTPTYFLWSVVAPGEKKLEETFRLTFESSEQVKKLRGAVEQVVKGAGIKPPASPAPTLSPAFGPKSPATQATAVVSTLVRPPPASQTTPTAGGAGKATFGGFTFSSTPVIKPSDNAHTPEDRNKAKPSPQFKLKESAIKVPPSPTTTTTTPPTPTTTAATATSEATAPFAGFTFAPSKPVSSAFGSSVTPSTAAGSGVTGSGSSGKGQAFVFGQGSPEGATSFASLSGHSASEAFKSKEGGVGFQPSGQPLFTQSSSPVKAPRGREEDGVDEYEPNVDFRPIIDLPDLVETKTGEEDETKVLSDRAKLFRFDSDTSQWKERGIGELKILRSVGTPPRFRIIMRREQVLKVCANHFISGDMKLTPLSASDRTWIYTAHDYAEEEMRVEKFAAKFKNPDTAAHFKTVFENCQKEMAEAVEAATAAPPHPSAAVSAAATAPKSPVKTDAAKPSLAELFKPAAGSWECPGCCLSNAGDAAQCPACQTPQPGAPVPNTSTPAPDDSPFSSAAPFGTFSGLKLGVEASGQKSVFGGSGGAGAGASGGGFKFVSTPPVAEQTGKQPSLAELFKPAAGSWECPGCCLSNAGDAALCPACQTPQPGAPAPNTPAPDDSPFSSAAPSGTFGGLKLGAEPSGQKSVFGGSGGAGAGTSGGGFKFVSTPPVAEQTGKQPSLAEMFKPAAGSWECPGCCLSNAGEAAQCPACQTPQPGAPTPTPAPDDSPFSSAAPTGTFGGLKLGAGAGATKTDDAKPAFPASGFKFGASPASASTEAAGFKFTPSKPAESTTTANPGGFKFTFGTQSGSVFGGTQSSASNVSAATTAPTQGATTVATTSNAATTTATAKPGFVFGGGAAATTAEASGTGFSFSTDAPATQESAGKDSGFSFAKPQPPPAQPAEKSEPCSGLLKQLLTTEDEPESTTPKPSLFGSAAIATPTASESPQPSGFQARLGQVTSPTTETQADGTTKAGFQFTFSLQKQQQSPHQASSSRSPEVNDQGFYLNKEGEDSHIYFEPVVSLPEKADIKTGEEDEETLFESRAKLYRFTNAEWKERGLGTLKILRHKNTCRIRLLMRREQVLKICCNHYITGELDLKPMPRSDGKAWVWYALDFTEGPGHMEQFAVRFRDVDTAGRFKAVFDESKEKMKTPSKADIKMLDPTAANSAERSSVPRRLFTEEGDGSDVVFLYEETPTPEQVARARKLQLPDTFYLYENRPGCPGCIGCEDSSRSPVAAAAPIESPKAVTVTATSAASTQAVTVTPTQAVTVTPTQAVTVTPTQAVTVTPTQAVTMTPTRAARQPAQEATVGKASEDRMFAKTTGTSFSALAATSGETPTFGPRDPSKPFHWAGAGQRLFGKGVGGGGEGGEEGEVVACDDIHFEPVIPLPDLVEVKTGEEDWGPLFAQRAKVYRYDGTQWKERGVGEMKIMKHVSQSLFRVLLRREQVLKVACNHLISTVMELKPMATSESAWCWVANDCSEGEPKLEKFAVKFKKVEVAKEFKAIFEDCQEKLREGEQKSAGQETMVSSSAHPTGNRGNVRHTQAIAVATQDAMTTSSQPACGDKGRALYGQEPTAGGDKGRALDGQEPTAGGQDWAVSSTQAVEGGDRGNPCVAQAPDVAAQDAQVTSTTLPPLAAGGGNPLFSTLLSPEEGWEVSEAAETGSTVSGTQAGEGGTTHLHSAALDTFTARVTTPLGDRGNAYHTREIESGCKDTEAEQEAKILGGVGNVCYTKQLDVSSQDKMVQRSAASLGDKGNVCYTQQLDVSSQDTMAQRSAASLGDKGNVCYTQQLDVSGLDTMTKRDVESLGDKGSVCYTKEGDVSAEDTMARHDAVSQGDTGNVYYTQQLNVSAQDTMAQRSTTSLGDKGNVYYTKQLDVSPQDTVTQTDRTGNTGQARDGSQAVDTASEHTTAKPVYAPQGTQGTAPASPEAGGKQRHGRGRRGLVFYPGRMESELLGTEAEEQYDDEDYDDDDEDEDESTEEEDDEEEMVEFDKRATMFRKGDDDQWEKLGMGNLRVLYDDDLNANKLVFLTDKGDKVCNHVIAMELTVATDGKKKTCEWQPVDYSTDEPVNRHFKAYFSSTQSMDDFATIFRQGQKLAAESGISVKLPEEIEVPEVFSTGDRSEGPMGKK